jgi:hypothetical protein
VFADPGTEVTDLHNIMESEVHDERLHADELSRIFVDADILPKRNPPKTERTLPETGTFEAFKTLAIDGSLTAK